MHVARKLRLNVIILLTVAALSGISVATAQGDSVPAPQETEYDLGFDCPASSTLDSTGAVLWVLMDNCGNEEYYVRGFNVADGTPVNDETSDFREQLAGLTYDDILPLDGALAFTPDGLLEIVYADADYNVHSIQLSLESGEAETPDADSLNTLLHDFTEYPEQVYYSEDHTRVVTMGEASSSLHILDLTAEAELLEIKRNNVYGAFPRFSQDGAKLYVADLNNPDDMEDYTSVLSIYSLPDGELLNTYDVPSPFLHISPDEKYAVAEVDNGENFILIELATGGISEPVRINEGESKVMACVNDGRSMSDVDFTTSGRLPMMDLEWLPDSSGFLSIHSYGGEGAGGGAPCFFNNSRLRSYAVP